MKWMQRFGGLGSRLLWSLVVSAFCYDGVLSFLGRNQDAGCTHGCEDENAPRFQRFMWL